MHYYALCNFNRCKRLSSTRNTRFRLRLHSNCLWLQARDGNFSYLPVRWTETARRAVTSSSIIDYHLKNADTQCKRFTKSRKILETLPPTNITPEWVAVLTGIHIIKKRRNYVDIYRSKVIKIAVETVNWLWAMAV